MGLLAGLYPHDYQLACALANNIVQIIRHRRKWGVDTVVVHSGDLTASGRKAEFIVGKTFLHGHHHCERLVGLGVKYSSYRPRLLDIPGNHDLWSRANPRESAAFSEHYGGAYPRVVKVANRRGTALFYGLDSNRSSKAEHRLAEGEVSNEQLHGLADRIATTRPSRKAAAVHIVSLHHPVYIEPDIAPQVGGRETLRLKNREAVSRQLKSSGVQAVLSGHVHTHRHYGPTRERPSSWIAGSACQMGASPAQFWLLDIYPNEALYVSLTYNGTAFWPEPLRQGRTNFG